MVWSICGTRESQFAIWLTAVRHIQWESTDVAMAVLYSVHLIGHIVQGRDLNARVKGSSHGGLKAGRCEGYRPGSRPHHDALAAL
ncbi:hypothetical protein RRG08_049299 [Elysia crispata]|uniref:Uncharacterized protein n=1 Tax=Elysia crispata TaxID=231223 RepID=A0AAE1B0R8_9GAST|nr:hypothetical protein RRG08_049299 [Elysia crispata]